ncbi:MAG TPA: phosphoribosylamine--glycine ligase [Gemmatimonadaceae bacterium]|nr:phosphoribosylamine--glycine ligase [Gemmatimonadaceae bacterium]
MAKVLLIGGGGREHAIAWKLRRDEPGLEIVAAPGNPGIAEIARCERVGAADVDGLVALAERERADVTVVGPEAPLAAGLVDRFAEQGLAVFGPTRAAAEIETSKRFAKQLMLDAGVPTAAAEFHTDPSAAREAVRRFGAPVVVKASGLAAGKGVIVCQRIEEADQAIDLMLREGAFGAAGAEILIEAFMEGEELSLFAVSDGTVALPLLPAQDHKRLLECDRGPNTGGMGAYAPVSLGTPALVDDVRQRILEPTLRALRDAGRPFRGLLYAGLMLTPEGPKVVEFNCRFGDPETQVVLPLMESSLWALVRTVAEGGSLAGMPAPSWRDASAVTTVVAAAGYPESPRTGDPLQPPTAAGDLLVFHAGTRRDDAGVLRSAGGRVLAITALAPTLAQARERSRAAAAETALEGKQYRPDIAWRELARAAAGRDEVERAGAA